MRYLKAETIAPIQYLSCGKLLSMDGFLHPKRKLDSTVLILVNEGTLYVAQDGHRYEIDKNQFIIFYENSLHWGWKKSIAMLSYYWVHFRLPRDVNQIFCDQTSIMKLLNESEPLEEQNPFEK